MLNKSMIFIRCYYKISENGGEITEYYLFLIFYITIYKF